MSFSRWVLLTSFTLSVAAFLIHIARGLAPSRYKDPAEARGDVPGAVAYSLLGAMSPLKKESARRHLPTYVMGIFLHTGVVLSFLWVAVFFFGTKVPVRFGTISVVVLFVTSLSGLALLVKRVTHRKIRYFSTPDDYFSNLLVVSIEALTLLAIVNAGLIPALFVCASALLLYAPLGKLRHAAYFVLARIYLGGYFGKRGVWGSREKGKWEIENH